MMRIFMKKNWIIGFASIILLTTMWGKASAYVGSDPIITPQSCNFTAVTAEFGPDGSIRYNVMGNCNGTPITGQMAYGTNQQMAERFYYRGAQISTKATCPADPWISGATCEDQQVAAKGADPGSLLYSPVPLSRQVVGSAQVFQHAHANAAHPNPPGSPVNAQAMMKFTLSNKIERAMVSWLGPDQQGSYGPYLDFIVEARPQNAEGAAWVKLGGIQRHSAPGYQLLVQFPPSPQGTTGWTVRTCSTTVFTRTCTGPMTPTPATLTERVDQLAPGAATIIIPKRKNGIDSEKLPGTVFSAPIPRQPSGAGKAALNPQPLPPKSLRRFQPLPPGTNAALNPQPLPPKAFGAIQPPSPGTKAALNPQPLPPRSFSFNRIMKRGVPEGEVTPEKGAVSDATPPKASRPGELAPGKAQPAQAPDAVKKSAP